jgi:hypothetical protein
MHENAQDPLATSMTPAARAIVSAVPDPEPNHANHVNPPLAGRDATADRRINPLTRPSRVPLMALEQRTGETAL